MNATPQVSDLKITMERLGAGISIPKWRDHFHSLGQMESGDMTFLINGFLPEGITFLGGLSGVGKTWFALSIAKALATGELFFGKFDVPEACNVLYLIPESGSKPFRKRLERMRIPDSERFLCQTMKDGVRSLTDPFLLEAVAALKPVVFLDTAIRFSSADSENDAVQNSNAMADDLFYLLKEGAKAIIGLHHAPKSSAGKMMTLENVLRGTGDLGAMCDAVYGIQCTDAEAFRIRVQAVKTRDFDEAPASFEVQGRPYINENGDFGDFACKESARETALTDLAEAIQANPTASYRQLAEATGIRLNKIAQSAAKIGWRKESDRWVSQSGDVLSVSSPCYETTGYLPAPNVVLALLNTFSSDEILAALKEYVSASSDSEYEKECKPRAKQFFAEGGAAAVIQARREREARYAAERLRMPTAS